MSYRGIKRVLGESSLERKIRILFGICLLFLIAGSFLWVNRITEDLIRRNTRGQANGLKSDFILRTHLENIKNIKKDMSDQEIASAGLFESLAADPPSIPYNADVIVLDDQIGRQQLKPSIATDPREVKILQRLVKKTIALQQEQNELNALKKYNLDEFKQKLKLVNQLAEQEPADPSVSEDNFSTNLKYYYYAPLVFKAKSECIDCHLPVATDPANSTRLDEIAKRLTEFDTREEERELNVERFAQAPPMFLRITLDNEITQGAITKSRAILISVAIVTAVLSMALLWAIVRYVIVKPLAHLRDVTEEVSHGKMDVRADLNTGDEFEELSRSFNRMLRHLLDTQLALQGAAENLDRKVDEQAQLNMKLYEMNQVKSEFLANMSHELRTPLNSIIGFSEILETANGLDDKQVRFASNIRNSGRLLLDLINDILDLAKLEAGKMEVKPSQFKIHHLVGELCEMVRNLAESKNIQLVYEVSEDLPEMTQDKIKVRQVLTNLLSNAIKFTPEGGRIKVTAQHLDDDQLKIKVNDTGVGIAEGDQAIVFEKFRQGPSAIGPDSLTREFSGTGLGLSIVKELCILLGGKIGLESEVGKGSTFTVTIPWHFKIVPTINSEISQTIDEITKQQRVDFARTNLSPTPPQDDPDAQGAGKPIPDPTNGSPSTAPTNPSAHP